jgi:hypothetical protein
VRAAVKKAASVSDAELLRSEGMRVGLNACTRATVERCVTPLASPVVTECWHMMLFQIHGVAGRGNVRPSAACDARDPALRCGVPYSSVGG